jgi:hypothetical protein
VIGLPRSRRHQRSFSFGFCLSSSVTRTEREEDEGKSRGAVGPRHTAQQVTTSIFLFLKKILTINDTYRPYVRGIRIKTFIVASQGRAGARPRPTESFAIGYCCASGLSPSQISSQNLVFSPLPTLKVPRLKKILFHSHYALPKRRIRGLGRDLWQRFRVEVFVLDINSCQTPFSFNNLNSHLAKRHLFFNSKNSMPRPP